MRIKCSCGVNHNLTNSTIVIDTNYNKVGCIAFKCVCKKQIAVLGVDVDNQKILVEQKEVKS